MGERVTLNISAALADELCEWPQDMQELWPQNTIFQADLADLRRQLDQDLPSHEDVCGILRPTPKED